MSRHLRFNDGADLVGIFHAKDEISQTEWPSFDETEAHYLLLGDVATPKVTKQQK